MIAFLRNKSTAATAGMPGSQTSPTAAQRVVLYEEDSSDPQGKRYFGLVSWRTETVSPASSSDVAVRADVKIPERRITMTWLLRRNIDHALPASHTIEMTFNLPADFPGGGVASVPGVLMKRSEQEPGTPLANMSTYAFESAERLICCFFEDGKWNLANLDTRTKRFDPIPTRFTDVSQLRASPGRAVFIGGTPTEPPALIDLDLSTGTDRVVRRSAHLTEEVRSCISRPELITFTTQGGETAHAFFYPPFSHKFTAPQGEQTPVLVKSHGGPTASASSTLSLAVQFWTSRGIGVLDVNYRGSTGYGRSYRLRLKRQWGIFDVQDCICGARYLTASRNADPDRLMISGGSAGGYTTLCALTPAA